MSTRYAALLGLLCWQVAVQAAEPAATISGGADESGKNYTWTVTNRSPVALVGVEIPHYGADLCLVPEGWKSESTNLVNIGVGPGAGVCKGSAPDARAGVRTNGSVVFSIRVPGSASVRGQGQAAVYFADGSRSVIDGVVVPVPVPAGDQYVSLIGLGVIFAGFVLFRHFRGRANRTPAQPAP